MSITEASKEDEGKNDYKNNNKIMIAINSWKIQKNFTKMLGKGKS